MSTTKPITFEEALAAGRFAVVEPSILKHRHAWRPELYTTLGHSFLPESAVPDHFFDTSELRYRSVDRCSAGLEHVLAYAAEMPDDAWSPAVVATGAIIQGPYGRAHPVIYLDRGGRRCLGLKLRRVAGPVAAGLYRFLCMPRLSP